MKKQQWKVFNKVILYANWWLEQRWRNRNMIGGAGVRGYEAWVERMHVKVKNSLPSPPPLVLLPLGWKGLV